MPVRAAAFEDAAEAANVLARLLDCAAFDPEWVDDDETYRRARSRLESLL